jgi:predicted nucleotidyltransferase
MPARIDIDHDRIAEFCRRWMITEFGLFGSVLRDDFGPESDVDVLVTFAHDAAWSLLDMVCMRDELVGMLHRDVDIVEKKALANPYRRRRILSSCEVIHAA